MKTIQNSKNTLSAGCRSFWDWRECFNLMKNNQYRNTIQDERIKTTEDHIGVINHELGDIKIDIAKIRTDVCWIKRWFWLVVGASVATIVTTLVGLLLKK